MVSKSPSKPWLALGSEYQEQTSSDVGDVATLSAGGKCRVGAIAVFAVEHEQTNVLVKVVLCTQAVE